MCACDCDGKKEQVTTPPPYKVILSSACAAIDSTGATIAQLDLKSGQKVTWCNEWSAAVVIDLSVPGFLPSNATQLTLQPGECTSNTVQAAVGSSYQWKFDCEGISGGGGGPVVVEDCPGCP
jgi:hypothetical protein